MEDDIVGWVTQERRATGHGCENAAFPFDAQVKIDPRTLRNPTHQRFGLMGVEIVADDMPARGFWVGGHHRLQMRQKIGLRARGSTRRSQDRAGDDIAADDQAARAMADVLEFAPLDFAWGQRQSWMLAFQGLDGGQLIGTHGLFSLLGQLCGLLIHVTDRSHRFLLVRIFRRSQPIADQVGLEIPFFNNRAACRGEICAMMPRAITSSAISRPVHWLIGRSLGCSQAMAIIWQVCSALIWAARPGRGASLRRSLMGRSATETACKPIQRMRHVRTVSTLTPSSRAIWLLLLPSAAARIMRPRKACCCGVLCRRTSCSSSFRSPSFTYSGCGFGPRIRSSSFV